MKNIKKHEQRHQIIKTQQKSMSTVDGFSRGTLRMHGFSFASLRKRPYT